MYKLSQSVLGYIQKHDFLRAGERVGAAVSGGADSVALLRILLELWQELGIVLSVVHLNHKLRGAESDADEEFVRALAAAHGLQVICKSSDIKAYASAKKLSLEASARAVRYEFFREALSAKDEDNLDRIATAHTLDDQAETVLMKLARGAGTKGLAGIYPEVIISDELSALSQVDPPVGAPALRTSARTQAVVRPLLGIRRSRLIQYLGELGQGWREDSSNRDLRHTRNRIRHGILPRLERHVNPSVREAFAEAADIARAEEEYWESEIARWLPQVWSPTDTGGRFDHNRLSHLGLALQRRLVRAASADIGLALEFRHVEELLDLRTEGARASLPGDWIASLRKGVLGFELPSAAGRESKHEFRRESKGKYQYDLPVPGEILVSEAGLIVKTQAVQLESAVQGYNPEHLLDWRHVRGTLIVRNWEAGERFWPLHTKEPKKIKELLQDRHITGDEKKQWPVVASGKEIVWVSGFGVRRDLQAKNGRALLIQEAATPD